MTSSDDHVLIPRTGDYISLLAKANKVADIIKLLISLRWGEYPGLSRWGQCNHKLFISRRKKQKKSPGKM